MTEEPEQVGLVPDVIAILTLATGATATASVIVTAVATLYLSPLLPPLLLTAFSTPYILIEPVPATGAVQGMDSTYVVPLAPVPVVAVICELCSMIGIGNPDAPVVVF